MQHLLERIKAGTLWDFHGGIHPPENKHQSSLTPVVDAGLPPQLIIPVRQHAGPAGELLVRVGDRVKKGQPLTRHDKGRIVPVHASTSGTITAIEQHTVAHPSGLDDLCVILTPDGEDAWGERSPQPDYWNLERGELLDRIQQAGVAGLGGAVFPTHSKLDGRGQLTEILIVNGLECEPYITTDDRLMQEYADEIMEGIRVLKHLLKPKLTLIGVEDNKPAAIESLNRHATDPDVLVKSVPTKYPSGGAKQTIELLTGRQVPKGGRAVDMGIMVLNVATVFAIKRAIIDGEPLISRIVTLTGDAFKQPGNAWVRLGTPVRWLLQRFELQPEADQRVIMGGPMMGFTLPHAMVPVVKATNCLLSPTRAELPPPGPEQACIRCSACADACPANLLPQELYWYSRVKEYDKAEKLNLFDCIECGACAWVCPSEIPLVQYYKIAKDDIREVRAEHEKAERAKQRFEAKQARFERDKAAREARHAEAAAQRRQAMAAAGGDDPVAAALARLKAKQDAASAEPQPDNAAMMAAREARKQEALARRAAKAVETAQPDDVGTAVVAEADPKKAAIAAALARAKAKKAAQAAGDEANNTAAAPGEPVAEPAAEIDPKKAAIAAALARAKAKKAAQAADDGASNTAAAPSEPVAEPAPEVDPKKAAIAATIARAKAKKAAQAAGDETSNTAATSGEQVTEPAAEIDPKKAAIAAAIARAKAKKLATAADEVVPDAPVSSSDTVSDTLAAPGEPVAEPAPEVDPKKAAIAAAIARAKAKKLAAAAGEVAPDAPVPSRDVVSDTQVTPGEPVAESAPEVDPKKAAIAAAIARAKAKTLAAADEVVPDAPVPSRDAVSDTLAAPSEPVAESAPEVDPKKAAIAAAIARAKAKKLAADAAAHTPSPSTDKSH
ncbi:electron transport complex subunit RsxC [Aeromonas media]|uniref:Ion-translocating oxidoreductase complex subunit C n=1 Tax=Aeromonas media TaxID=651 RepID=A0AAE7AHP5_AERME|nr:MULTISPECIES: electron transport complex subunit RsxC [Aeromonas]QJT31147.1 electron transport complex subunit RsxC [Aeromonas media]WED80026.1 electron transport complex subunit RsxC [Aeromonas media]